MKVIDNIAVITDVSEPICNAESILDTILSLKYETGASAFAFYKACFNEAFFRLSSGIAGEVIQKFVNYGVRAQCSETFPVIPASRCATSSMRATKDTISASSLRKRRPLNG